MELNNKIDTRFEKYAFTENGEDLFDKAARLNTVLERGVLTGVEGLGFQNIGKLHAICNLKDSEGTTSQVIMLGSNSYLNLSTHPQVIEGAKNALEKYGYGMGSVSNYTGITDLHKELEKRIAHFYNTEDSIVFPSGYGTNIGVITALCGEKDVIINDSANHASIMDGARLSGAKIKIYPHNNMEYLEKILKNIPDETSGRLIITDGVFSMSGECAKLDKITELAAKYGCRVMVDDAHGVGVVGETGRGSAELYGVMDKIDLHVGMLSKSPGGLGGYCSASASVVKFLRIYARPYFFSTALPAPLAGGLNEVFKLFDSDNAGRCELHQKTMYLKEKLIAAGFDIGKSCSAIVPVMIYDEDVLFKLHKRLYQAGLYTNIVTYPAVRRKLCRLRLCVMKDLSYEQLDIAVKILKREYEKVISD